MKIAKQVPQEEFRIVQAVGNKYRVYKITPEVVGEVTWVSKYEWRVPSGLTFKSNQDALLYIQRTYEEKHGKAAGSSAKERASLQSLALNLTKTDVFPSMFLEIGTDTVRKDFVKEALIAIADASDPTRIRLEPDEDMEHLMQWLNSAADRANYVTRYVKGHKHNAANPVAGGQMLEKNEVLDAVLERLKEEL
jgi:hypothetical protein